MRTHRYYTDISVGLHTFLYENTSALHGKTYRPAHSSKQEHNLQCLPEIYVILISSSEKEKRAQGRCRFQNIWVTKHNVPGLPYTVSITRCNPGCRNNTDVILRTEWGTTNKCRRRHRPTSNVASAPESYFPLKTPSPVVHWLWIDTYMQQSHH
jgi:hypothetical protein